MHAYKATGLQYPGFFSEAVGALILMHELLKFDLCRRKFEKRLKELGDEATEKFDPVVHWMRLVIADKAPELLNETHFNK